MASEPRRAKGYSCGIPVSSSGMRDRAKPRNRQPVDPSTPRRAAFPPMDGVDCESTAGGAGRFEPAPAGNYFKPDRVEETAVKDFASHFAKPGFLWILLLALPLAAAFFY